MKLWSSSHRLRWSWIPIANLKNVLRPSMYSWWKNRVTTYATFTRSGSSQLKISSREIFSGTSRSLTNVAFKTRPTDTFLGSPSFLLMTLMTIWTNFSKGTFSKTNLKILHWSLTTQTMVCPRMMSSLTKLWRFKWVQGWCTCQITFTSTSCGHWLCFACCYL